MRLHKSLVEAIATKVRQLSRRHEPFRIFHGSTNSTRQILHHRKNTIDISHLSRVVKVDVEKRTALVEPNVPMDRLVETTMKYGLVPPVVMEFPGITAGGGYSGTGGESSSFKYGFFNETVRSVEMILGNGDVITASDSMNSDLLHGASGAVGSLGIATLLEIQLIPARKYVKVCYQPTKSSSDAIRTIHQATQDPSLDFVDGILFSQQHGAVITGSLTDDSPDPESVRRFSNAGDPWFYLHVKEKTAASSMTVTEFIPLAEYLFRYDRGGFWVGASAFEYFKFPFNRHTRKWLDDFLHTRMLYRALHASGQSDTYVVQDLAVPYSTAEALIDYSTNAFNIWPLWLCPLRSGRMPTMHPHSLRISQDNQIVEPLLNIGLWGFGPAQHDAFIAKNRALERKLRDLHGMKWLYAHTYYREDEFWDMFDRQWYEGLREKYHAGALLTVWDKVHVDPDIGRQKQTGSWLFQALHVRPLGGLWGIWKAIESGDYRIARDSTWKAQDPVAKGGRSR